MRHLTAQREKKRRRRGGYATFRSGNGDATLRLTSTQGFFAGSKNENSWWRCFSDRLDGQL